MIAKVKKTTFEEERQEKDESFLRLTPLQRLDYARKVRARMKKTGLNYSFEGMVVRVIKTI
jgi:hypothetical protein